MIITRNPACEQGFISAVVEVSLHFLPLVNFSHPVGVAAGLDRDYQIKHFPKVGKKLCVFDRIEEFLRKLPILSPSKF